MAGIRSALRKPTRSAISKAVNDPRMSLNNQMLAILRKFGSNAHVYIPGSTQVSYGAELVTNGTFDNGTTGWDAPYQSSISNPGGVLRITAAGGTNPYGRQLVTVVPGKKYRVSVAKAVSRSDSSTWVLNIGSTSGTYSVEYYSNVDVTTAPASYEITVNTSVLNVSILSNACPIGQYADFDNISVREVITTSTPISGLLSNNYTLSDGSTGYSAIDGSTGLVLDAAGSVGAELNATNWSTQTGFVVAGGQVTLNASAIQYSNLISLGGTVPVIGNTYLVSYNAVSGTGARLNYGGIVLDYAQLGLNQIIAKASNNTDLPFITAMSATGTNNAVIDNISVKEVTGIHASQSTGANRPGVRRGLYNAALYSQNIGGASWSPLNLNAISANLATPATNSAVHCVQQAITTQSIPYTLLFSVKPNGYTKFGFRENTSTGAYCSVDCNGAGAVLANNLTTTTVAAQSDGSYLIAATWSGTAAANTFALYILDAAYTNAAPNAYAYAGNGTSGMYINGFAIVPGTITAAQALSEGGIPLTTAAAASNAGAGRYSWQFDGTNDQLVCATAPFQIADDFAIVVAVNANTIAGFPGVLSVDDGGSTNAVALYLNSGVPTAYVMAGGTLQAANAGPAITAGSAYVLSIVKTGSSLKIRKNGVDGTTVSTVGVGSAAFNAMRIGYQAIGLAYWSGAIGEPMFIKGTVSASDVLTLERQVASTFPACPTF